MRKDNGLTGLRVAVTGGTSGLGLALVRQFYAYGANVAFVARTPSSVQRTARELGVHGIVGDVGRKEDIYPIALQITAALGGLDVLINNASSLGRVPLTSLADTECEALEKALAVNVLGPFRLTKALLGALAQSARERRGGVVLNVSSDAAVNAYAGWGAYGASKAALRHLTAIWSEEMAAEGICFLSVDPGDMDTPLHALAVPDADPTTLKRPEQSAAELIDSHRRGAAATRRTPGGGMTSANDDARPAKLISLSGGGQIRHSVRRDLPALLRAGDLVVANDAATLPASFSGRHAATGAPDRAPAGGVGQVQRPDPFRRRRLRRRRLARTHGGKAAPARLEPGDMLALGPLLATVERILGHPRFVTLRFAGTPDAIWAGIATHGRPIQYSHAAAPYALWDVWTAIAARPIAFEPPSAGFALDWRMLAAFRKRGVEFATLTHAAGISSTGDPSLDARLPLDEPFHIPEETAAQIARSKARGRAGHRHRHDRRARARGSSRGHVLRACGAWRRHRTHRARIAAEDRRCDSLRSACARREPFRAAPCLRRR